MVALGLSASAAGPVDTWVPAGALPARLSGPVFALAVDPANPQRVLAGAAGPAGGGVYRSEDGGASWMAVRTGLGRAVESLAFAPGAGSIVLAGTRGAGVWRSDDAGVTWQQQPGSEGQTVRGFAFLPTAVLGATDQGVLASRQGAPWTPSGLSGVRVGALIAGADESVVAGGDASQGGEPLPLFSSIDAGETWNAVSSVIGPGGVVGGSSTVAALAVAPAGDVAAAVAAAPAPAPVPTAVPTVAPSASPDASPPPAPSPAPTLAPGGPAIVMGTNTGLFTSADGGGSWQQVTGGGELPAADFTAVATSPRHPERLYVASDGGGSDRGGVWVTADGGAHFSPLAPPQPEVTAMAVSSADPTTIVIATLRPADQAVAIWTYRDDGGTPHGVAGPAAVAAPAATATPAHPVRASAPPPPWLAALERPETPYLALALSALGVLAWALGVYAVRGRSL